MHDFIIDWLTWHLRCGAGADEGASSGVTAEVKVKAHQHVWLRKVLVTPLRILPYPETPEESNRILRQCASQCCVLSVYALRSLHYWTGNTRPCHYEKSIGWKGCERCARSAVLPVIS